MNIKKIALITTILASATCGIKAQSDIAPQTESHIRKGEMLYSEGKYAAAESEMCKALGQVKDVRDQEKAEYIILSSRYEQNKAKAADFDRFIDKYPYTEHRNTIYFMAGNTEFRKYRYEKAIRYLKKCDIFSLPARYCEEGFYALAVSYRETSDYENARINFAVISEMSSRFGEDAKFNLAYIEYHNGNLDKAKKEFNNLQHSSKFGIQSMKYLADIHYRQKDYGGAIRICDNIFEKYGDDIDRADEVYRTKGMALYNEGNYYDAISNLEKYTDNTPDNPQREALYMLGMSYFRTQGYTKAARILGEVTTKDDELTQNAYLHIGLAQLEAKNMEKARLAFEHASSSHHNNDITLQALYNYALCIHETSYSPFNESVKVFERLINEYPGNMYTSRASEYLADAYLATTDYESSLESIAKIKNPNAKILAAKQKILLRLGIQQFANGEYGNSIASFSQSIQLGRYDNDTKAEAYYWRGEAYYRTKQYDYAEKDFRMYAEYESNIKAETYALAYYNLGYINFKKKGYARALNYFSKGYSMNNNLPSIIMADMANRIGDCYYQQRNFTEAERYYAEAAQRDPSQGDYAMFQRSFILGLQKDYAGKINQINQMLQKYPQSVYCDDAMFEKGRAYVMSGDNNSAISTYKQLVSQYPASDYTRRAESEIALLYYQNKDYAKAEAAYKDVISKYLGTAEAAQARNDLKSLYVDLNKVDEYFEFTASIGHGGDEKAGERDSLTYMAAEKIYMDNDRARGTEAMKRYLEEYPEGIYHVNANYYVGLYLYNAKKYSEAIPYLERVNRTGSSQFTEEALVMLSETYYDSKQYSKACETYTRLKERASSEDRKIMAETGIMRCMKQLGDNSGLIAAATEILAHSKADPQIIIEARYLRAKAYTAMSQPGKAIGDWKVLAEDTRNVYGAEAKFRVAEYYFNAGNNDAAEKEILDYIEKSTPHAYWMARSFILLADVYSKEGKKGDARQYLLSLKQNYSGNDDIADMIESRLKKLENN